MFECILALSNCNTRDQCRQRITTSTSSKSSTHFLNDTNRFDVSSKGSSSGISGGGGGGGGGSGEIGLFFFVFSRKCIYEIFKV